MKKLLIFGNTELAKIFHFFFQRDSAYQIVGFTVDNKFKISGKFCGLEVFDFETIEETHPPSDFDMVIAVGPTNMNKLRETKFIEAKEKGYSLASYISPNAVCDSTVGENTFVGDMAVINPFVEIGSNNFFFESSIVSNDAIIENNCYFSPFSYVGTFCKVCNNSLLGINAVLKTSIVVAEKTLIGAKCYISKNTEKNSVFGERNSEFLGNISHKINISI